ncbi:MAG: hypothetical protein ACRD0A_01200 [Acidimicrobiales bacterium]
MNLTQTLQGYFQGEKQLGIGLAVFGVLALGAAVWVWRTQAGAFALWLLVPLVLIGAGLGIAGTVLATKSQSTIVTFTAQLQTEPDKLIAAETERMAKVNASWPRLKMVWAAVTLVALFLLLAMRKEWASAFGLSLLLTATTLFFVDVFAERRATVYTAALTASAPSDRTPK